MEGKFCYLCLRAGHSGSGERAGNRTQNLLINSRRSLRMGVVRVSVFSTACRRLGLAQLIPVKLERGSNHASSTFRIARNCARL